MAVVASNSNHESNVNTNTNTNTTNTTTNAAAAEVSTTTASNTTTAATSAAAAATTTKTNTKNGTTNHFANGNVNENNKDNDNNNDNNDDTHNKAPTEPPQSSTLTSTTLTFKSSLSSIPSNERLLCTAFVSFASFAIFQTIAAIVWAKSEAMIGDSAAMMVDALTYLFNWYAEHEKQKYANKLKNNNNNKSNNKQSTTNNNTTTPTNTSTLTTRGISNNYLLYRKYTLQLEIVPPFVSVLTLLVVTGFVLHKAIHVLILDTKRDSSEQSNPNVHIMMIFSILNLGLDFINVLCFAKAKHALGYSTEPSKEESFMDQRQVSTMQSLLSDDSFEQNNNYWEGDYDNHYNNNNHNYAENDSSNNTVENTAQESTTSSTTTTKKKSMEPFEIETGNNGISSSSSVKKGKKGQEDDNDNDDEDQHQHDESNLNMCSAYTHVFADTLRSIAVIVASILAEYIPAITSEEADASAAVVVSILIALSLIPLFTGMIKTIKALRRVEVLLEEDILEMEYGYVNDDDDNDYKYNDDEVGDWT